MEKKLPKNWVETELGSLAKIQSGGTPSRGKPSYWNGNIPWVKISDIKELYVAETDEFITEEGLQNSSTRIFPKGTILFTIFATIGKIGILNIDATTNQAIAGVTPISNINKKYLIYSLIELSESLKNIGKGVAQSNINLTILNQLQIPLPPLPEQERIVAKLDLLFAQHEKMKTSLEKIPQLLKDFRQQILTQAVTGKLTEEWRKGKDLGEWKKLKISDLSSLIGDGLHGTPKYDDNGEYYFINGNNLSEGKIIFKESTRKVDEIEFKKHQKKLNENTVFLSINGTLGNTAFYENENIILGKSACYINVVPFLLNKFFLRFVLVSPIFMKYAEENATGTTIKNLGLKAIRNYEVHLPIIEEQTEIVSRVESLFSKIDAIELRYQKLKEKLDQLPQTILHKAFKGELVPQLPTDGDAKDLLKEILALKKEGKKK